MVVFYLCAISPSSSLSVVLLFECVTFYAPYLARGIFSPKNLTLFRSVSSQNSPRVFGHTLMRGSRSETFRGAKIKTSQPHIYRLGQIVEWW